MIVCGAITVAASGSSTPSALNRATMPLAIPSPNSEPDHRGQQPDHEALEHDRAHDLLARGAERPQRGELPRALGDGDRQRVEDDERADEQRDAAEAQQEHRGSSPSTLVELRGVVLGLLGAVLHLQVGGEQRLDGAHQLARGDVPCFAAIEMPSKRPSR